MKQRNEMIESQETIARRLEKKRKRVRAREKKELERRHENSLQREAGNGA